MSANRMHAQGSFATAFTANAQSPTPTGDHFDTLNGFQASPQNSNHPFIVSPQPPQQQNPHQASSSKSSSTAAMPRENIRSIRNQAEKQRRDKLNGYINELAANVPFVTQAKKRQDKTSVLRLAAAYIRLKKLPLAGKQHLTSNGANFFKDFLDSINGFVLISNCRGKILFVSPGVEKQLGHQDNEVIGYSLDNFLHEDDIGNVSKIINNALTNEILQGERRSSEISFVCRLKEKNQSRTEVSWRQMRVTGHMTAEFAEDSSTVFDCVKPVMQPGQQQSTSGKSQFKSSHSTGYPEESEYYRNGSFLTQSNLQRLQQMANDIIFVCHVEEIHAVPDTQMKLSDIGYDEYVSRHSLDGTLLYADHRIASILGFLPKEVSGKSAYDFILPEDYSIALFAHKLMLSSPNGTGIVVHRLTGVDNSVVFLQTMGCLKFNDNGLIDHFACVSRMLKESDGERELEYFVNRFTPHIANKSAIELYESMQMQCINPFSSKSFSDLATAPDAKSPTPWRQTEHKRLLPARFERYARDQHKTMVMQRHNHSSRSSDSSPQAQIFTKIEEPDNEQILQISLANTKLHGVDTEEVAMQNKLTLQKSIRNLNEKCEFLMVKSHHAKNGGRKRALTASQDMDLQKKAKHSNPNNTFIRSFISADKSTKKPTKNGQATCKSVDSESEDCLHKSKSVSGVDNLPESRYKIAHGQSDYTYMLGARFYAYNHLENAKVLSIYTPPEALEAQQRGRLITDAQTLYNPSGGSTPTPSWVSPTNQSPGAFFGPLENNFNSPYLNFQNEQSGNLTNKGSFVDAPSSSSATPTHSRTPDMTTPLCEELESGNIDCQLDAMQQANNAVGPSVNFHLHHHHLKRSNSSLNQYNSDSCSNFAFEYSEPPPILPVNEASFPEDDSSSGIKDYLSQIDPNTIFSGKMCETDPLAGHGRGISGPVSGEVQQNGSIFVPDTSRSGGDNSYPSSGQTNNNSSSNNNANNANSNTNYSTNACYQYSLGPSVNPNGDFDSMGKPTITGPMYQNKMLHDNSFRQHFNTHAQSDQSILTMGVHQPSNLYNSYDSSTLNYDYVMRMEALPTKVADVGFSLSQPENSYDFAEITEIMNSALYSPETQFSNKMDSDSLLLAESDFVNDIVTGKRVNNASPADNTSTSSEEFL